MYTSVSLVLARKRMLRSHIESDQYNDSCFFSLLVQIKTHTKVCSEHFLPDCLVKTKNGLTELKEGALPTVFAWSSVRPERRVVVRTAR